MHDLGAIQLELKQQMASQSLKVDQCSADQKLIAQQVKANGQAVAHLTIKQFDHDAESVSDDSGIQDEDVMFENVFAKQKGTDKAEPSFQYRQPHQTPKRETLPHHTLPKMHFPTFDGTHPRIWLDKCRNYFSIYTIPDHLWYQAATMHFEGSAAKWIQAYKQLHPTATWQKFIDDVQLQFGSDDYRSAINELLERRQTTTVEEYTTQFQSLQYDITMHSYNFDSLFFASYVNGLKDEIRAVVEPQVPSTVDRAAVIAKIQQRVLDRNKLKYQAKNTQAKTQSTKSDQKNVQGYTNLWRDKQLRDYRKANNLCYFCGEKYEPEHAKHCAKRNKPQVNALVLNDLDREINEEVLNEIVIDEALTENFCQLSLKALAGTESSDSIRLQTTVKNKTMLILVDTGSSHSFVSTNFVQQAKLSTVSLRQ